MAGLNKVTVDDINVKGKKVLAVINKDDLFSEELKEEIKCPYETFSLNENADITAGNISFKHFFHKSSTPSMLQ